MIAVSLSNARRALSATLVALSVAVAGFSPVSAQPAAPSTTIDGVVASQPNAPAKLQSCSAVVTGRTFVPQIAFEAGSSVKTSTVTYAFFTKANVSLGKISLTPPYESQPLPVGVDNFTCAISSEQLADGSLFPTVSHSNTGLVIGGVVGVAIIAALAGHGSSASTPSQPSTPPPVTPTPVVTASPSPTPTASPTAIGATPSPTPTATPTPKPSASPTAIGATPSPTPTASATAVGATPTPTASPTATPTPTPTPSPVGALTLNPNSLTFTTDNATMQTTIAETTGNYTGTFRVSSSTCASGGTVDGGTIATVSPATNIPNPTNLTVTSKESGNCSITFVDTLGNSVTLTIDVTTTSVVVNRKHRAPAPSAAAPPARKIH